MNRFSRFLAATFLSAAMLLRGTVQGQAQCVCSANPAPGDRLDDATIAATGILALIGNGDIPACFLQRNPISPSIYTACESWRDAQAITGAVGLPGARKRFWETHANKLDKDNKLAVAKTEANRLAAAKAGDEFKKASQEFAEWLFLKDLNYVKAAVIGLGEKGVSANRLDFIRAVNAASLLYGDGASPTLDGGIKEDVAYEFYDWAMDVREQFLYSRPDNFSQGFAIGMMGPSVGKAVEASRAKYKKYVAARDWGEFDAQGSAPAGFEGAQHYGELLYLREGKLKPAEAKFESCSAAKVLGQSVAQAAAQKVLLAPKDSQGNLVERAGLPRGAMVNDSTPRPEGVIGVYKYKLVAFEKLMTLDDDRRFLVGLLTSLNHDDRGIFVGATKWCFADSMYNRYVEAFGPAAVLQAAHAVRVTPKRMTDGWVLDTKAIGSTRFEPYPAFEEVLVRKEPLGYARAMLGFGQNLYSAGEIDGAYQRLSARYGADAILAAARKMAAGRPDPTSKNDLQALLGMLGGTISSPLAAPAPLSKTPAGKGPGQPPPASPTPLNKVPQIDIHQRYRADLGRSIKANSDLMQFRQRTKTAPPADIQQALSHLNPELRVAQRALVQGDPDHQAEPALQDVEATLAKIDAFLQSSQ